MPWCFPVFPLKLLGPRRFRDCCYVLAFGAWWRLVPPRVYSAFFFFWGGGTLVFVDVSHRVLILLSLSLCVVLLGVEGFGKPKKLPLLLCLPRILEHVFPFSNFLLLTSLGFVFKSCYPLIRSMFFEPGNRLPAGDGGSFLHRLISGHVSTASAELSCFLSLKCLPPTSPWLTRLVLKMPSIRLSSIVGAFSRIP